MDNASDAQPRSRWPLFIALALLTGGAAIAAYLTYVKLRLGYDPTFESACNFGGKFNCDQVQTHPASEVLGLPIALYAIPAYLVMGLLAWLGLRGREGSGRAVSYLGGIGLLTVFHAAYLAWVSHSDIGFYCPYCMALYAVNLGVTVCAIVARGRGFAGMVSEALGGVVKLASPMVPAAVALVVVGGVSVLGYQQVRTSMLDAEKARVAAELEAATNPALAGDSEEADPDGADQAGAEVAAAAEGQAQAGGAARPATRPRPKVANPPKARMTDNGLDWFDIPLDEAEHALGPQDAPVTYVAFKDFECGFCRFVAHQEKPLKAKYSDKVRFVFKHYPMNGDCNYRMGGERMHPGACRAAFASVCAEEQGKFWEMHDVLYQNQKKFSDEQITGYAEKVGLDAAKFSACLASDRPKTRVERDVRLAARMRINGTPRIYINNRLVTGSTATDVLDYYIQLALENPEPVAAPEAKPATEASARMVQMRKASGPFWIDAFEASVDKSGQALSVPGVTPAMVSWFEAEAACKAAGKRMCTEEEWVSACIGEAATDENANGRFVDGPVQGRLYPYGPFYEKGACRDSEDKYNGEAGATGANPGCVSPEGVYDLTGNLYEWIGASAEDAAMIGGDWRSTSSGTCRRRTTTYGAGIKNNTTGFRCCADAKIEEASSKGAAVPTALPEAVGAAVPKDLVLDTLAGGKLSPASFKGKVTYLTFYASWCGNCRKQMPAIKAWQDEWQDKGFQVVAINVDRTKAAGEKYTTELEPNFTVAFDPTARTMSDFDINAMPTSFIVGRDGVITDRVVGYREAEIAQTKKKISDLL